MAKAKPAADLNDDLDALLDGDDLDGILETEPPAKGSKKKATPPKKGKGKAKVADKKSSPEKKAAPKEKSTPPQQSGEKKLDGLTKMTEETGTITFKADSGSQGILLMVIDPKIGFDRKKILESLDLKKFSTFRAKYFGRCDPAKKVNKIFGIIKNLQKHGFKLPKHKDS